LVVFFENSKGQIDSLVADEYGLNADSSLDLTSQVNNVWSQVQYPNIIKSVWGFSDNTDLIRKYYESGLYKIKANKLYMRTSNDKPQFLYTLFYDKTNNMINYRIGYELGDENSNLLPYIVLPFTIVGTENAIIAAFYGVESVTSRVKQFVKDGYRTFYPFASEYSSQGKNYLSQ
jgi:hypothetical protein